METHTATMQRSHRTVAMDDYQTPAAAPRITYGKRNKLLPLKGTHFKRRADPYNIPADTDEAADSSEAEQEVSQASAALKKIKPPRRRPGPGDSPLSDEDLETVYGRAASPILSISGSPHVATSSSRTSVEPISDGRTAAHHKKGLAKTVPKPAKKPGWSLEPRDVVTEGTEAQTAARAQQQPASVVSKSTIAAVLKPTKAKNSTLQTLPKKATSRHTESNAPARRLPVNELLLVPHHQQDVGFEYDPPTSYQGAQTQDPIADTSSSSPLKRRRVSLIEEDDQKPRAPLTSIRKRLKTPMFTHKSVVALRKRHRERTPFLAGIDQKPPLGDGFDISELKVDHSFHKRVQRRMRRPLLLGFSKLDLGKGPLPDVKFEPSSELCVVAHGSEGVAPPAIGQAERPIRRLSRRVSFSERVLSDAVKAKLSSVSAPARRYSISSDEYEADDDDQEILGDTNEDHPNIDVAAQENEDFVETDDEDEEPSPARTPPSNQRAMRRSSYRSSITRPTPVVSTESGASFDFRNTMTPGMSSRKPFGKRRLMEVNENILDAPTPDIQSAPIMISSTRVTDDEDEDDYMLDSEFPPVRTGSHYRPRSILRNHTPNFQDRNTRPESAAANTRRNSRIDLDHENSRYFTNAVDMLDTHDEPRPRIIKSRTSDRHSHKIVQIPDSDRVVPETSQQMPDYTNFTNLNVLKRSSEAVWTSSESLPRVQKDLKTLTRSVSREAGTLSQGLRRRPSRIEYRSPTKTR